MVRCFIISYSHAYERTLSLPLPWKISNLKISAIQQRQLNYVGALSWSPLRTLAELFILQSVACSAVSRSVQISAEPSF